MATNRFVKTVIKQPIPARPFQVRDAVVTNTTLSWPWFLRPWVAFRILIGANYHISVRTGTEHVVGRTRNEHSISWDFLPWWPRKATSASVEDGAKK